MVRPHLFEFLDLAWYPDLFRNLQTDMIQFVSRSAYEGTAPSIARVLRRVGGSQVLDLCSGAGGPWPNLLPLVAQELPDLNVRLSDKFPNRPMFERLKRSTGGALDYVDSPVLADAVPADLTGMRTVFQGFHHLRPEQAKAVLQDAAASGRAIGVFDVLSARTGIGNLLSVLLPLPLLPLLFVLMFFVLLPRLKPVTLPRILFTYLIPLVPLATAWDYLVSGLRSYTKVELEEMAASVEREGYVWEVGQLTSGRIPMNYVLGYPAETEKP